MADNNSDILKRYLPAQAVEPVIDFINANKVRLVISRPRSSKLGDYRSPLPQRPYHQITVNCNLPKYFLLCVLIHEMAHLNTFLLYKHSVMPHGYEWQREYSKLLLIYTAKGCFPPSAEQLIKKYTGTIPLNHSVGNELERHLKAIDNTESMPLTKTLKELPLGTLFRIKSRPSMLLRSIEKLRTRYRCIEETTGIKYLVSGNAEINLP